MFWGSDVATRGSCNGWFECKVVKELRCCQSAFVQASARYIELCREAVRRVKTAFENTHQKCMNQPQDFSQLWLVSSPLSLLTNRGPNGMCFSRNHNPVVAWKELN